MHGELELCIYVRPICQTPYFSSIFRTSQVSNIRDRVLIKQTDYFAEHLDRVRGKLQTMAQTARKSSGMLNLYNGVSFLRFTQLGLLMEFWIRSSIRSFHL